MCQTSNCQLPVGMRNLFFPLLYVWQVLMSGVIKHVGISNVCVNLFFPFCSIGIIFLCSCESLLLFG